MGMSCYIHPRLSTQVRYRLGNGVKFYMLEVEDYSPSTASQRRTVLVRRNSLAGATLESHHHRSTLRNTLLLDASQDQGLAMSQELESQPFTAASPPTGSSSLPQLPTQSPVAPIDFVGISPPHNLGGLSISPPSPSPAPVVIPSNPRSRTASGHSHSLIRPSLVPSHSPLRRPDSIQSTHSSRPSTAVSHLPGYPVAASPSSAKGAATIALADETILHGSPVPPQLVALPATSDASSSSSPPVTGVFASRTSATPSPAASATDGLSNVLLNRSRKRTLSTKAPPTVTSPGGLGLNAGGALASFGSSWRIPLGRSSRRSINAGDTTPSDVEHDSGVSVTLQRGSSDARSLLRRLDANGK